jgi:hypothetical protein
VNDYDVGTIPPWSVVKREGGERFTLIVIDSNALLQEPGTIPIATPSTVLASLCYQLWEGFGPPGNACSLSPAGVDSGAGKNADPEETAMERKYAAGETGCVARSLTVTVQEARAPPWVLRGHVRSTWLIVQEGR